MGWARIAMRRKASFEGELSLLPRKTRQRIARARRQTTEGSFAEDPQRCRWRARGEVGLPSACLAVRHARIALAAIPRPETARKPIWLAVGNACAWSMPHFDS